MAEREAERERERPREREGPRKRERGEERDDRRPASLAGDAKTAGGGSGERVRSWERGEMFFLKWRRTWEANFF